MKHTSLSATVEEYLSSITTIAQSRDSAISPLVKRLSGVIKLNRKQDYKKQVG